MSREPVRPTRPLLWFAVFFALGIAAERVCPFSLPSAFIIGFPALLLLCLAFLCSKSPEHSRASVTVSLVLFLALGFALARVAAPVVPCPPGFERVLDRPHTLFIADIASPPDFFPDKIRLTLSLRSALLDDESVPLDAGVLLSVARTGVERAAWVPGDRVLARLTLRRFHNFNNPGGYDYVMRQAERGIHARAGSPDDRFLVRLAPGNGFPGCSVFRAVRSTVDRFRQESLFWLRKHFDPDTAAFYAALLLGYQQLISADWKEDLNRVGITHLLSISGMHLGLVSMFTFWICRRLIRRLCPAALHRVSDKQLALWPALAAALLYAFLAGFGVPPIWRSLLMLTLGLWASFCYRHADSLTILAATALIILIIDPAALWQVSFQLTYACMVALFVIYPRLQHCRLAAIHPVFGGDRMAGRIIRPFEEAFHVSVAVNILVLPLTVFYFQGFSLAGFIANIILVPLVGFLVLPSGLLGLGLLAFNESLAALLLQFGAWWVTLAHHLIRWFSDLSWAYFHVGPFPLLGMGVCYLGLFVLLSAWRRKWKGAALCALALFMAADSAIAHWRASEDRRDHLQVDFIDVGQGTSTLVRFPDGAAMLVDGGGFFDDSFDIGRAVVAPFLWRSGIRRLDYVVLSHDHPDHRNGLRFVMQRFEVGCLWTGALTRRPGDRESIDTIAALRGIPVRLTHQIPGECAIGRCRVKILHPSEKYLETEWNGDINNASLVLKIDYGETGVILPGDIGQSVERVIFGTGTAWGNVVLGSPHHGSDRSNSPFMVERLKPRAVVVSCGADNRFGFPSPAVLETYRKHGVPVYRTDRHGAVHAVSDGTRWEFSTFMSGSGGSSRSDGY
ncbi:MAG TPA: DNA internalization-related competence protein ComEC/Rec2 [Syntrophobacter fumaroxidans]|nr:DNA internalization-related competence protein ComEC/Rec2 [Syntrophobacter fumaroxidans]